MNIFADIKILNSEAYIPKPADERSAGYDLKSMEDMVIPPGMRRLFKTGIALSLPDGVYGRIAPRSGLARDHGIDVLAGVIDPNYTGEIGVILINLGTSDFVVAKGDRIAQIIFENYNKVSFSVVDKLAETERNQGGFGSTGR